MLGERFANPAVLAVLCADEDDEVVAPGIVRVEEVSDYTEEAEAAGEQDELVFSAKLLKEVLLILLSLSDG